jgi:hypothetical protein
MILERLVALSFMSFPIQLPPISYCAISANQVLPVELFSLSNIKAYDGFGRDKLLSYDQFASLFDRTKDRVRLQFRQPRLGNQGKRKESRLFCSKRVPLLEVPEYSAFSVKIAASQQRLII